MNFLGHLNPFTKPDVATLVEEEIEELQRLLYLEDKRADHHRAQANAINARIAKLRAGKTAGLSQ